MMLNNLLLVLDFIFPPRAQTLLVRRYTNETINSLYSPSLYAGITYLSHYETTAVSALIQENKYFKNKTAAQRLATLLSNWLQSHAPGAPLVLLPIPLSTSRQAERGYNQVLQILRQLPPDVHYRIEAHLLERYRDTASQTTLIKSARLKNVSGAFSVKPTYIEQYAGYHFIIIDDVVTTGATLEAARTALSAHLPPHSQITLLALAH